MFIGTILLNLEFLLLLEIFNTPRFPLPFVKLLGFPCGFSLGQGLGYTPMVSALVPTASAPNIIKM